MSAKRYFFHVNDGEPDNDRAGVEFSSLDNAKTEAVRYAAQVMLEDPKRVWGDDDLQVCVTNAHGLKLFTIYIAAIDSPAIG